VAETERLDGRDHEIWARYVGGWTQARLAAEYDVSQQRISQVLADVRATVGDAARADAGLLAQERTDALLAAVWPAAMGGDTKAVMAALRVLERQAKAMGTDAVEPLRVTLERRLDLEGQTIAEALRAAFEALELSPDQQAWAAWAASVALYRSAGQEPPEPPPGSPVSAMADTASAAVVEKRDLMEDFRRFAEREGFDPDGLDDEDEDDDDTE